MFCQNLLPLWNSHKIWNILKKIMSLSISQIIDSVKRGYLNA